MPRQKEYNKEEVTEKAMKVFWENGYKATSMRTLEKEMGINLYSIYAGFDDKQGIFIETLKRYRQLNKEVILRKLINSEGEIEDIRLFFYDFVESVKSGKTPNGCLFANTTMEFGSSNPEITKILDSFFTLLKQTFFDLLEKAVIGGNLNKDADIDRYANYLVGCTEGLSVTAKVLSKEKLSDFIETSLMILK